MKNTILNIAVIALIMGSTLTGCNSPTKKVDNSETDSIEAREGSDKARADYTDIEKFKTDMNKQINTNNQRINDFNSRVDMQNQDARAEYQRSISDLERRNNNLKKRLNSFQAEGKEDWEQFKTGFSRELNDLGQAFNDFTGKKVNQ